MLHPGVMTPGAACRAAFHLYFSIIPLAEAKSRVDFVVPIFALGSISHIWNGMRMDWRMRVNLLSIHASLGESQTASTCTSPVLLLFYPDVNLSTQERHPSESQSKIEDLTMTRIHFHTTNNYSRLTRGGKVNRTY